MGATMKLMNFFLYFKYLFFPSFFFSLNMCWCDDIYKEKKQKKSLIKIFRDYLEVGSDSTQRYRQH